MKLFVRQIKSDSLVHKVEIPESMRFGDFFFYSQMVYFFNSPSTKRQIFNGLSLLSSSCKITSGKF